MRLIVPLVLWICFVFCYVILFNSTSRYLDGLLNIDNSCFDQMVSELQLNKVNSSDMEEGLLFELGLVHN